jgi:xanthine permease XanP
MQESQTAQSNTGLIYGLNDRPPVREAIFAAIQHLLAIFVAIITPPLIIAGALKLDLETTSFLVSMSLFASGISTFIQCRRIGGAGTFFRRYSGHQARNSEAGEGHQCRTDRSADGHHGTAR